VLALGDVVVADDDARWVVIALEWCMTTADHPTPSFGVLMRLWPVSETRQRPTQGETLSTREGVGPMLFERAPESPTGIFRTTA